MKEETALMNAVNENRDKLSKQESWANKQMKQDFMKQIVIEEHYYGNGARERLDYIYKRSNNCEHMPVLFYIHGGGWIAGNKEARRVYCGKLAEYGYFVVNIEYDLAPEQQFPFQIGQCMKAVDYFLDNAEKFHVNCEKIVLGGESAGVYYAAFVSAISKNKHILEQLGLPMMKHLEFDVNANMFNCGAVHFRKMAEGGFPDSDTMLQAYTGFSEKEILGGEREAELERLLPFTYVDSNFPPSYLIYGKWDALRNNTFYMKEQFDRLEIPYHLFKATGLFYGQHTTSIILKNKKALRIMEGAVEYLKSVLYK